MNLTLFCRSLASSLCSQTSLPCGENSACFRLGRRFIAAGTIRKRLETAFGRE